MRVFNFQLRLPDGRIVSVHTTAGKTEWRVAFANACIEAERVYDLGPWSAIACVAYTSQWVPADRPTYSVAIDDSVDDQDLFLLAA